jgi:uncharacterized protein YndB with AHSA1/START domain
MPTKTPVLVHVTHRFEAPAERVFEAWLDPREIGGWMFGVVLPDEILHVHVDARVGGSFSFLVRREGREIDHVGEYLEVDRPRRLAFTWGVRGESDGAGSRVTVDIASAGSGATLDLTHELPADWAEYAARTEGAWTKMLGALDAWLAR